MTFDEAYSMVEKKFNEADLSRIDRDFAAEFHPTGLLQERDHLTLRTRIKRLARKTICFSKSLEIHKAVIGTFINIYFFGRTFDKSLLL